MSVNARYAIYLPNGLITSVFSGPSDMADKQCGADESFVRIQSHVMPSTHYVDLSGVEPVVAERADNPTVLSSDTLSSIPSTSKVEVISEQGVDIAKVSDGSLTLKSEVPGDVVILVRPSDPKYKEAKIRASV